MDRKISPPSRTRRFLPFLLLLLVCAGAGAALLSWLSTPRLRVEADKLAVATVRAGTFQEYILPAGELRAGAAGPEVRAAVDRHEAPRLAAGQKGTAEIGGRTHELEIVAIGSGGGGAPRDPAHDVEVALRFSGAPPPAGPETEPGGKLHVRLPLGEPRAALLLDRGAFFQASGGRWVWVLDAAGEKASRREVRLGRQNPEVHEVLSGLAAGERVIVSTYDHLEGADELVLTR